MTPRQASDIQVCLEEPLLAIISVKVAVLALRILEMVNMHDTRHMAQR